MCHLTVAFSLLRLLGIGGTKNTLFVHIYNILNEQACLRPKRRREKTNPSEAKKEETRRTCLSPGMVPIRSPLARVHVMLGRGTPRAWQMISVPAINMIIF